MTEDREGAVIAAFVSLAENLVGDFDVVDLLSSLTVHCADVLDIASAGLLLADGRGVLHVLAASSERTRSLELFQLQREEGPCLDSFRTGSPIGVEDLNREASRWPMFSRAALDAGFASVHAVPMRLKEQVLGTLGLFGTHAGTLNDADLRLAQALADVASISVVHGQVASDRTRVVEQLQTALDSRVVIEQAKGILSEVGGLDMEQAFVPLRSYARNHNRLLTAVARAVVARELPAAEVLNHAPRR